MRTLRADEPTDQLHRIIRRNDLLQLASGVRSAVEVFLEAMGEKRPEYRDESVLFSAALDLHVAGTGGSEVFGHGKSIAIRFECLVRLALRQQDIADPLVGRE